MTSAGCCWGSVALSRSPATTPCIKGPEHVTPCFSVAADGAQPERQRAAAVGRRCATELRAAVRFAAGKPRRCQQRHRLCRLSSESSAERLHSCLRSSSCVLCLRPVCSRPQMCAGCDDPAQLSASVWWLTGRQSGQQHRGAAPTTQPAAVHWLRPGTHYVPALLPPESLRLTSIRPILQRALDASTACTASRCCVQVAVFCDINLCWESQRKCGS